MKNGILLVLLVFTIDSFSQIIEFTDLNLKQFLINENCIDTNNDGYPDENADANNDGEIQLSEALSITNLTFNSFPDSYHVTSVQDLSLFTNLQGLVITHFNSLEEFSLIGLDHLTSLWLGTCQSLKYIDISDLNSLDNLRIEDIADIEYLNLQNNNFPSEVFSLFYSENIQYACVDNISEEYDEVALQMAQNVLPSIDCSLGIMNLEHKYTVEIFPNPTNSSITIDAAHLEFDQIIIFDVKGNEVFRTFEAKNLLDISFLNNGIYFLQLKANQKSVIKRIIKI